MLSGWNFLFNDEYRFKIGQIVKTKKGVGRVTMRIPDIYSKGVLYILYNDNDEMFYVAENEIYFDRGYGVE